MFATERETARDRSWYLVSDLSTNGANTVLPIPRFPCTIGRQPEATIRLVNPTISRSHAELSQNLGEILVRDLGSSNGTYRNGRRLIAPEPITDGDLLQLGNVQFRLQQGSSCRQSGSHSGGATSDQHDLALAIAQFDRLFIPGTLHAYFQPIVSAKDATIVGFEALARSDVLGLSDPRSMFEAARCLSRCVELSQALRDCGVDQLSADANLRLFLNTHPAELEKPQELVRSLACLRQRFPKLPLTIEIHEGAKFSSVTIQILRQALDDLQMELAFDDFGAGESRLAELVAAHPHCLKFDMNLVRNLHSAPRAQRQLLGALVTTAQEMGIQTLAEGVESAAEAAACRDVGFDLFQGFYFGRPQASGAILIHPK